ncbi:MAG TPA: DUF937 domain-containing protein [Gemmatimonadales bacterium]|nr:DUF937 domain-containing protein [Gemmatimonadales bacterium]
MNITDMLAQTGGLQSMARELGISENQASAGAAALLPAILGGFQKKATSQSGGLEGLAGMLGMLGGGALADDVVAPEPTHVDRGNAVLGQIFGSKDVSRAVAANASEKSGLDASVLKKMLPMLAMLAAGYMAKQRSSGTASGAQSQGGGLGGLLGGLLGGAGAAGGLGGLASMLDSDGDGNPLDDIIGMMGKGR